MKTINQYYSMPFRFILFAALLCLNGAAQADNYKELKYEISFLASKLLDESGKDTITIKQPAIQKPFLGVCPKPGVKGLKIECITPGHSAAKAGLKTGDLILSINGLSMASSDSNKDAHKWSYNKVFDSLETGKELELKLLRGGQEMVIDVTVGSIRHPAYTMTISRDEISE